MTRCACSPSPTAALTASHGRIASGSGPLCGLKTAPSTRPPTRISKPAPSGSIRHRSNRLPCSAAPPRAGSLYWLGTRDASGAFLDGGKTYKLTVPQPVPAKLFWSLTIYDPDTRSEIVDRPGQGRAPLSVRTEGVKTAQAGRSLLRTNCPAGTRRRSGSRRLRARAGSPTSASTAPKYRLSTEAGSRGL